MVYPIRSYHQSQRDRKLHVVSVVELRDVYEILSSYKREKVGSELHFQMFNVKLDGTTGVTKLHIRKHSVSAEQVLGLLSKLEDKYGPLYVEAGYEIYLGKNKTEAHYIDLTQKSVPGKQAIPKLSMTIDWLMYSRST